MEERRKKWDDDRWKREEEWRQMQETSEKEWKEWQEHEQAETAPHLLQMGNVGFLPDFKYPIRTQNSAHSNNIASFSGSPKRKEQ